MARPRQSRRAPSTVRSWQRLPILLLAATITINAATAATPTRPFQLSFTYQPHDRSQQAFAETYAFIAANGGMIFHYLDEGVPWEEALQGRKYHSQVEANLAARHARRGPQQKLALGTSFLAKDRRRLAAYWGEHDGMEVDAVEFDLNSDEFTRIEIMAAAVYQALHREYPELPLVLTFVLGLEVDMRKRIVARLLPYTDIYAVSIYPYLYDGIGGDSTQIPPKFFSKVRDYIGDKPFAVAETGFNAKPWRVLRELIWLPGSERSQAGYVDRLLRESERLDACFVNWWVPRDLDALWQRMRAADADPLLSQWISNGLVDSQGRARAGLDIWRHWRQQPRRETK